MNQTDPARRAAELDAADPLASFRDRFHLPRGGGKPLRYFCGHSLGLQPVEARDYVDTALRSWAEHAVDGHFTGERPWLTYLEQLRDPLCELVGGRRREVTAMNALTVNLHLLMASFFRPQGKRRRILIEAHAFPSDRYAVLSQLAWHGLDPDSDLVEVEPAAGRRCLDQAELEATIREQGEHLALVLLPGVQDVTGQAFDLARLALASHEVGARVGFDLAHAVGNIPLALHDSGADFAAWCSYKYLNGGPGCIAGAFVHGRHLDAEEPIRLAGWWANDVNTRFRMDPELDPAPGVDAWQISNPPILSTAPLLASLAIFREAGLERLREKSLQLTGYLEQRVDEQLADQLEVVTPRDTAQRGCQLSLRTRAGAEAGRALYEALRAQGFICDWREPDIMRVAPVPLYNTYGEVRELVDAMVAHVRD